MKPIVKNLWFVIAILAITDIALWLFIASDPLLPIIISINTLCLFFFNLWLIYRESTGDQIIITVKGTVIFSMRISGMILVLATVYTIVDLPHFVLIFLGCMLISISSFFKIDR